MISPVFDHQQGDTAGDVDGDEMVHRYRIGCGGVRSARMRLLSLCVVPPQMPTQTVGSVNAYSRHWALTGHSGLVSEPLQACRASRADSPL